MRLKALIWAVIPLALFVADQLIRPHVPSEVEVIWLTISLFVVPVLAFMSLMSAKWAFEKIPSPSLDPTNPVVNVLAKVISIISVTLYGWMVLAILAFFAFGAMSMLFGS